MKLHNLILKMKTIHKRVFVEISSISLLITILLVSCYSTSNSQPDPDGITFIASTGSPPVDSIAWSPIDNEILVTAGDAGQGRAQVYLLNLITGQKKVLADADYGDFVASTWAPDGKHVLLLARKNTIGSGESGLWILDIENDSLEYLLDSGYAVWSPDGKTIATFSVESINTVSEKVVLSLIDVDKKTPTKIYENLSAKYIFGLSWSPDGENLIFSSGEEDPGNLYTFNLKSRQVTQITESIKSTAPAWSPVGNIIAYVRRCPRGPACAPTGACQ
jgi:Tol biopolymer transport system component